MTWCGSTWLWQCSCWWVGNWLIGGGGNWQESLLFASWSQTQMYCLSLFYFSTFWPRICIPCLILLVHSMLICKGREKWYCGSGIGCLSRIWPNCLGFPHCLDIGCVKGARPGLYGWESNGFWGLEGGFASSCLLQQMPQKGFWRNLLSFCTQRTDFSCVQCSFGAWLISWNHPSFPLFLTCPMV